MGNKKSSFKSFVLGAVIGGVVGTVAVLLYMPQTGKKLRRQLKSKGEKFKKDLNRVLQESQKIANDLKGSWDKASQTTTKPETIEDAPAETRPVKKGPSTKKSKTASNTTKKKPRFFRGI